MRVFSSFMTYFLADAAHRPHIRDHSLRFEGRFLTIVRPPGAVFGEAQVAVLLTLRRRPSLTDAGMAAALRFIP